MEAPIKRTRDQWDRFFFRFALEVATCSKDPDRQVGAVLVPGDRRQLSMGYNGFPEGIPDLPSHLADKAFKLANMVHAEENCLHQSPFNPSGCTMYVTRFPCHHCAERIQGSGVSRVVAPPPELGHPRWGESWARALDIFKRGSVEVSLFTN